MEGRKVAVVTGSSYGIGFEIVKRLCDEFNGDVILTARNEEKGQEALRELAKEGFTPKFHQLDICCAESISALRDFLQQTYGGLDILVNNAGVSHWAYVKKQTGAALTEEEERLATISTEEFVMKTNYQGTVSCTEGLLPILRPGARVVTLSSRGALRGVRVSSEENRKRMGAAPLTRAEIDAIVNDFKKNMSTYAAAQEGWPDHAYQMSKWALIAYTADVQRRLEAEGRGGILANSCCPGTVKSKMSAHLSDAASTSTGADTPVYLALLPADSVSPRGAFVAERQEIPVGFTRI